MALSLTAEQKNISSLFYNEDQYVIPEYQRPYCWNRDTLYQMYSDIMSAYSHQQEDYFIGTIILARSEGEEQNFPQIVDGQQRIVTLWLFLKVMYLLVPDMKKIRKSLEVEQWNGNYVSKIKSNVRDSDDPFQMETLWKLEELDKPVKDDSPLISNYIFLKEWLSEYFSRISNEKKQSFIKYFINQVYLLPIELKGKTQSEANDKALTIFETFNNRGQNLEDADIFKAKLYDKASSVGKTEDFLDRWSMIKENCEDARLKIDDLFKIYSHVLRGKQGVTTFEKSLRDFFVKDLESPLIRSNYEEVTDELFCLLALYRKVITLTDDSTSIGMWLKILSLYSSYNYPRYAVISYLYKYGEDDYFERFLENLVRICYGSSSTIKFVIYSVIRSIFADSIHESHVEDFILLDGHNLKLSSFSGKGMTLLAFYLVVKEPIKGKYSFGKILSYAELKPLMFTKNVSSYSKMLGNMVVLVDKNNSSYPAYDYLYFKVKSINHICVEDIYKEVSSRNSCLYKLVCDFLLGNHAYDRKN